MVKLNFHSKLTLLIALLLTGAGTTWADNVTFTFGNSNRDVNSESPKTKDVVTVTVSKNGSNYDPNFTSDANDVRFQSGNKMEISCVGTITKVVLTYTATEYANKITKESFNVGSYSHTSNSTTGTWTGSTNKLEIVNKAASQTRISQIVVTYTPASTKYELTAISNNSNWGTVSVYNNLITATPEDGYRISTTTPYEVTVGTATVTQNDNIFTVTATDDCTIKINFEAIPTYDVNWLINGSVSSIEKYKEGEAIFFPTNIDNLVGKTFMGWVDTEITGTADEVPTFVTSATMGTSALNYYAVFAKKTPGNAVTTTDDLYVTITGITIKSSYSDWSDKTVTSSAVFSGNCAKTSDNAWQLRSSNNSGIVTTKSGGRAAKITVIWNKDTSSGRTLDIYGKNSAYTAASDLYSTSIQGTKLGSIICGTSTELTISGDYTYIGIRSNNGAMYIDKISIDWVSGTPDSYSGYLTTFTSVDITLAASGYASYCSPFALDLTPTENYAAWAVTGTNGTAVTFKKIEGAVPAGTPFILYGQNFGGETATLPIATGETTAVTGNMLKGTLAPTDVTTEMEVDGVKCTLFGLSKGSFVKINPGTIAANKAYLPIPTTDVPSAARLAIVFSDETTGISETVQPTQHNDSTVYDLQGRKVDSLQGSVKGLYIVNGKKVLVK